LNAVAVKYLHLFKCFLSSRCHIEIFSALFCRSVHPRILYKKSVHGRPLIRRALSRVAARSDRSAQTIRDRSSLMPNLTKPNISEKT